jgi:ankyrin repeat protein
VYMRRFFSRLGRSPISRCATVVVLVLAVLVSFPIWSRIEICRGARDDNLAMVKVLLKVRPNLVFSRSKIEFFHEPNDSGWTPLHYAAAYGHNDVVELLLAANSQVNAKDSEGRTPLHVAAYNWQTDVADSLLNNGADVDTSTEGGWTPLHTAVAKDKIDMVQWLLAHKADINAKAEDGQTPLYVAARNNYVNMVKLLLANGADINARVGGWTALHAAVEEANSIDVIELLLTKKAYVNAVDNDGRTPLHMASRRGCTNIVELLRQHGGQDATPANTAILDAAEDGDLKAAEALLAKNPALVFTKAWYDWTPLHFAAKNDHKDVAQLLLTNRADVNAKDREAQTPLHVAVMSSKPKDLMKLLLAAGADVNAKNERGQTPLHLAVNHWWQDVTIAELLLDKGADVNIRDNHGQTALRLAMRDGEKDVAELLRQHGGQQ